VGVALSYSKLIRGKRHTMKISTNVKAGGLRTNHNEKLAGDKKRKSLTVKTGIKAGASDGRSYVTNHNEKLVDDKN
jgi:hypothetical protein